MEKRICKVDRILALPESLTHHIMSFLSLKQVIRTSVVCKTWNEAWYTVPNLEFYHNDFNLSISIGTEILKSLEKILLRRHMELISIKKITFHVFFCDPESEHLIDRCLCYAFGSNVKELNLLFYGYRRYNLPQLVYTAQSLNVLELTTCTLLRPRISVELFLRKLCLYRVEADDYTIQNLIAGCPLIEYLSIDTCHGFKSLELFNLSKLDYLKVRHSSGIYRLNMEELNVHSVTIEHIFSDDINIASCNNIKCLKLSRLGINDDWLCNAISKLLLLEDLAISDCTRLQRIKISGPCLKALSIARCTRLVVLKIETPNLSIFKYKGNKISFSSTALALSETKLYFWDDFMHIDFSAIAA